MSDDAAAAIEPQSLSPEQLDELVEGLDGDSLDGLVQGLDTETINQLVAKASPETAKKLVSKVDPGTFDLSTIDPTIIDAKIFDTDMVALVVGMTPDEKLAEALDGDLRDVIVPEVFNRMPERLNATAASAVEAAIEWRITRDGGDPDHYVVVLDKGTCRLEEAFEGVPRVTLEMGPVEFLKVVTGNGNPVEMFMAGKLRVQGDIMFGAQVPGLFRIPKPHAG